jgi:predicted MPP superfamily phosphohydrolase
MNFLLIIIFGYILVAAVLITLFWRDQKQTKYWLGRHRSLAWAAIGILSIGILMAISSVLVYPNLLITNYQTIKIDKLEQPIKIAFITDIQIGNHKKTAWMEKIVQKIGAISPDIVIWGGDLIDNEGNTNDESQYLEPIKKLVSQMPMYYIMGNHEYGVGSKTRGYEDCQTGDRSEELITRMQEIGVPLLRNQLVCPENKNEKICLFGIDDIWEREIDFTELKNWDTSTPMIFIAHNPDGTMLWPKDIKKPNLVLAGHTHGGQIWLPLIGPLGRAGVDLGTKYYRGLNYWNNIPIFTSVGAGESAAPIRFWVAPEIAVIDLKPL